MSCVTAACSLWPLELCALGCACVTVHPCAVTIVCAARPGLAAERSWLQCLLCAVAAGPLENRAGLLHRYPVACDCCRAGFSRGQMHSPAGHRCFWPIGSQGQVPTWLATWSAHPQRLQAHSPREPNVGLKTPTSWGEDLCGCDIPPICESHQPQSVTKPHLCHSYLSCWNCFFISLVVEILFC